MIFTKTAIVNMAIGATLSELVNRSAMIADDYYGAFAPAAVLRMYDTCQRKHGDSWLINRQDAVAVGATLELSLRLRRLFENLNIKTYDSRKMIPIIKMSDEPTRIYEPTGSSCNLYKLSSRIVHSRRLSVYEYYVHVLSALGNTRFPKEWDKCDQKFSRVIFIESSQDPASLVMLQDFLQEVDALLLYVMKVNAPQLQLPSRIS